MRASEQTATWAWTFRPRFWRIDVDVDQDVVLGDGVIGGRDLAVANADGQDEIDVLERRLGGAGALLAVAPADGQRVMIGRCIPCR